MLVPLPITILSLPADTLKLTIPTLEKGGFVIVLVPVLPEYVQFTVGVPVIVKFVTEVQFHIVALLPVSSIVPVPKAKVLTFILLLEVNTPVVNL